MCECGGQGWHITALMWKSEDNFMYLFTWIPGTEQRSPDLHGKHLLPAQSSCHPYHVFSKWSCSSITTWGPRWNKAEVGSNSQQMKTSTYMGFPPKTLIQTRRNRINHLQYTLQYFHELAVPPGPPWNRSRRSTILKKSFQEELLDYLS